MDAWINLEADGKPGGQSSAQVIQLYAISSIKTDSYTFFVIFILRYGRGVQKASGRTCCDIIYCNLIFI